ncbi:MAG: class I SAM-dependent methyltransferase [Planctomycetota bacterium]
MEKTNYPGHEQSYQKKRQTSEYVGWLKRNEFEEDWTQSWQKILQKSQFPKQGKVIELGCGAGNISISLAQLGYKVVGIDIAPTAIAWAKENAIQANVNVQFIEGNLLEMAEFPGAPFDIVIDGRCLHCIIGKDREQFLKVTHGLLNPGGILAINTMCNEVPQTPHFQQYFDPVSRCTIQNGISTRYIGDSNDILQEVIRAGFRMISVEVFPPQNQGDAADLQIIAKKVLEK